MTYTPKRTITGGERPPRLIYRHESNVVHVRWRDGHTRCGLPIQPKTVWRDEGVWDGKPFETLCANCHRALGLG